MKSKKFSQYFKEVKSKEKMLLKKQRSKREYKHYKFKKYKPETKIDKEAMNSVIKNERKMLRKAKSKKSRDYAEIGEIYCNLQKYRAAFKAFHHALFLNPNDGKAYAFLADFYGYSYNITEKNADKELEYYLKAANLGYYTEYLYRYYKRENNALLMKKYGWLYASNIDKEKAHNKYFLKAKNNDNKQEYDLVKLMYNAYHDDLECMLILAKNPLFSNSKEAILAKISSFDSDDAYCMLAKYYLEQKDIDSALKYFELGYNKDYPETCLTLAKCYLDGVGLAKDVSKGFAILEEKSKHSPKLLNYLGEVSLNFEYQHLDYVKAFKCFVEADKQGYKLAKSNMGYCYYNGYGVEMDIKKAFRLFSECAVEDALNLVRLGICYYAGIGTTLDLNKACNYFKRAAELNNASGYEYLALTQLNKGLDEEAENNFKKAIALGQKSAVFKLGHDIYCCKRNDYQKVYQLAEEAIKKGNTYGECLKAIFYYYGLGVEKDLEKALSILLPIADKNAYALYLISLCYYNLADYKKAYIYAQKHHEIEPCGISSRLLCMLYIEGHGVIKDEVKAFNYIKAAAYHGDMWSENSLAYFYDKGIGTTKDEAEAFKWYKKAAEQGSDDAQYNLGNCYCCGIGTAKDMDKAFKWYKKAAEQGIAEAQYNLGLCYDKGVGTTKDMNEALKWYEMAAEQDCIPAQKALALLKK